MYLVKYQDKLILLVTFEGTYYFLDSCKLLPISLYLFVRLTPPRKEIYTLMSRLTNSVMRTIYSLRTL